MSLLTDAVKNDSGLAVAGKYLIDVVAPFFEMPLTGDTQKVHDFQLQRRIGEMEALIYRIPPNPSGIHRMRYLAEQLIDFAVETGVPLGSDDAFRRWVLKNGTLEDKVMATVCEIDIMVETAFNIAGREVQALGAIRKNLLVNFTILEDLQQMMMSGGPGSEEELDAFELAVKTNLEKGRRILDNYDYV